MNEVRRKMDNEMGNDEWQLFLRKQQARFDLDRARSIENISKVEAILKRVSITQERAKKLLATLK